ncbi:MAG: NAD(P)H-dependent glycerol-3-phosphate dehydrogenase, partial [Vicinamibacteria bacterium]
AKILSESGLAVTLWCREEEVRRSISERRENNRFLPGVALPSSLRVTGELGDAVEDCEMVLLAVPSPYMRSVLSELTPAVKNAPRFVSATKGLEESTHFRMSEVISQTLDVAAPVVLSGPTFAREVALGEPTALVAASADLEGAIEIQERFSTPSFRIYTNDDVLGVELGGALKNVIALAVGVATGLGLGHNPKAALMTRGLAEISRLVEAMGGWRETLFGLAGMGDLVLTCTGHLSRNRQVGIELGKGRSLEDVLAGMEQVAEGVRTTHAAVALSKEHGVEMPIVVQMERLLRGETTPEEVMRELMTRPLKAE